jgi:hypothetical protein
MQSPERKVVDQPASQPASQQPLPACPCPSWTPACSEFDQRLQISSVQAMPKILPKILDSPSHRIFEHMHEALNIDKK